jgi:hypothetical protein
MGGWIRIPALPDVMLVAALTTASCASEARPPAAKGSNSDPAAVARTNIALGDSQASSDPAVWRYGGIAGVAFGR